MAEVRATSVGIIVFIGACAWGLGCSSTPSSPSTSADQSATGAPPPGAQTLGADAASPGAPGDPGTSSSSGGLPPTGDAGSGDDGGDVGAASSCAPGATTPYRCSADGMSRASCAAGAAVVEACPNGCLRQSGASGDDTCMGTTASWSCSGSYGTTKAANGNYDITAFGCWVDAAGGVHTDPGDNCLPTCFSQAKAAGLCLPGDSSAACEERITWFTADAARFGCLARLRITNPATGVSVVAVALDYGPSCSVEASVGKAVLDASGRVDRLLFGADQGASDRAAVHVVEVDPSTPLGPVP